jgi:DNA-binding MarR family transcriptional regulator
MKTSEALRMSQFATPQQQLMLTVMHTASSLHSRHRSLLKPFDVTPEQFNILRILRGQKGRPLPLRDISARMIDRNSNTSRLIDKLVDKGHVIRESCPRDRRKVDIALTEHGVAFTQELSNILEEELSLLGAVWNSADALRAANLLDAWNATQP